MLSYSFYFCVQLNVLEKKERQAATKRKDNLFLLLYYII